MLLGCIIQSFYFPFFLLPLYVLQDEDAFFKDYAVSHKKLSELGFTPPSFSLKEVTKSGIILAQSAVGVAVAAAVVILSYIYEVRRKTK